MPTFARGYWTAKVATRNAAVAKRQGGQHVQTSEGKITWMQDPTDLRGIPAIGRGVAGCIAGTNPANVV
jgi:hypothetical protein